MQGSSLTIVLVIAISVLINLILTLIIRRKDKSQKTIKNINNQIQTFRSDVTTLSERIRALGQETLQNVDAKASVVRDMLEKVEDELSSLSEHSQDLSALQSVCISYKNALDKLRIATDQAEARIRAVQEEVEKAESVNDFIRAFQSDAEALTGQLGTLRDEYTRLVSSTEESLRQAAESQKNENQDMLQEFAVSLENFKSRFSEFAASEREALEACYQENSLKAAEATEAAEEQRNSILKAIEDGRAELENYRNSIDTAAADTREAVESLDAKAASVIEDVQKTVEDEKNILTTHAEDCMRLLSDKGEGKGCSC